MKIIKVMKIWNLQKKKSFKILTLSFTAPWYSEFAQLLIFKHLIFMSFMVNFCF